jgi:hypothetical protein
MIFANINKIKTNSLITLSKNASNKGDDSNNYIFCNKCDSILGFELKYNINKDSSNNKNNNENFSYLIKKNIKERKNKHININLISFKENLLKMIKEELNEIFKSLKNVKTDIRLNQITKQNFEDFSKFYTKKEFDFTFVIHKMEGRIFLLGKNGYFNSVENCLLKKQNSNLFFILISSEVDKSKNNKIIEELIKKGGEEELEKYYINDRIIFLDSYEIKEDLEKNKEWFLNKINGIFGNNNRDFNQDKYYVKSDKNIYILDKRKIDGMIEYLYNRERKGHGCFS